MRKYLMTALLALVGTAAVGGAAAACEHETTYVQPTYGYVQPTYSYVQPNVWREGRREWREGRRHERFERRFDRDRFRR